MPLFSILDTIVPTTRYRLVTFHTMVTSTAMYPLQLNKVPSPTTQLQNFSQAFHQSPPPIDPFTKQLHIHLLIVSDPRGPQPPIPLNQPHKNPNSSQFPKSNSNHH